MSKHIIICCDGTWNTPNNRDRGEISPTNVVRMSKAISPRTPDGTEQLVCYYPGVGTMWSNRLLGGAFGVGITKNIQQAYCELVDNYDEGDKIFFFGFSRGAYTVRSIAGLINNSGLLYNADRFNDAYKLYRRRDKASKPNQTEA